MVGICSICQREGIVRRDGHCQKCFMQDWRELHKERIKAYRKKYNTKVKNGIARRTPMTAEERRVKKNKQKSIQYAKNPGPKKERQKFYAQRNQEKIKLYHRQWFQENIELVREYGRQWYRENSGKLYKSQLENRMRRRGQTNPAVIKQFMIDKMLWYGGFYCEKCGRKLNRTEKKTTSH